MDPRTILSSNKIFTVSQIQRHVYLFGDILLVYAEIQARLLHAELCGGWEFWTEVLLYVWIQQKA